MLPVIGRGTGSGRRLHRDAQRRQWPGKPLPSAVSIFILNQGILPPDLARKAVLEDFMPSQR
jgi:hypothetical protein